MSDLIHWKEVKTRKPHKCFGCAKTYARGSIMISAAYVDGLLFGCYWCKTCQEYMHRHFERGDETGEGEIYKNDPEGWEAINKEIKERGR